MRFTHTFIDRPILATVLSVFVTLIGLGALAVLPVAQYPEIVPPTVQITAVYPGASAETVSRTVATPLEQQINGVENMLYMSSQSTGDGKLAITVTFRIGTDLNVAQMLTQNAFRTHCHASPTTYSASACRSGRQRPASFSPFTSIRRTSRGTPCTCPTTLLCM